MAIDPEWADMMGQEIEWLASASVNGYGARTYAPAVLIPCHIDGKRVEVISADGQLATGEGSIWLDDHYPGITTADRIILPDRGGERGLVEVKTVYDEDGPHHTKLVYGG